uniref:Uncharacterized protein n=1 Tax=viral metagenome TaxID=1070528 RepID=A0A6M3IXT5_9ZZZZ
MNELEILVADKLSEYFHDPIDIPCPYCEAAKAIIPTIKIAAIQEVVGWLRNNLEPTVPMTLDYRKWHKKLKEWGVKSDGR